MFPVMWRAPTAAATNTRFHVGHAKVRYATAPSECDFASWRNDDYFHQLY